MVWPVSRRIIHLYSGALPDIVGLFFSRRIIQGSFIDEFSGKFAEYTGVQCAVPVSSGSAALQAVLKAAGFPSGSEVIVPAYEDLSVPRVVSEAGLVPVFCDIDPGTHNIDAPALERLITTRTVAIIAAHLFGNACDVAALTALAGKHRILLIEDCAHAMGTRVDGKHVGNFGGAAFFSFHSTKNFMCFGGGMAVTNDPRLGARIRACVDQWPVAGAADILKKIAGGYLLYWLSSAVLFGLCVFPALRMCDLLGIDVLGVYDRRFRGLTGARRGAARMANVQAMVGIKNLRRLDGQLERTRANAFLLDSLLDLRIKRLRSCPGANYYFFIIFSNERGRAQKKLLTGGVDTGVKLMRNCPVHFNDRGEYGQALRAIEVSLQVPVYETMPAATIARIAEMVNRAYVPIA